MLSFLDSNFTCLNLKQQFTQKEVKEEEKQPQEARVNESIVSEQANAPQTNPSGNGNTNARGLQSRGA